MQVFFSCGLGLEHYLVDALMNQDLAVRSWRRPNLGWIVPQGAGVGESPLIKTKYQGNACTGRLLPGIGTVSGVGALNMMSLA